MSPASVLVLRERCSARQNSAKCTTPKIAKSSIVRIILFAHLPAGISPTAAEAAYDPDPNREDHNATAATGAIFQDLNPGHASVPDQCAGQAAAVAVSPDGTTLAVQTSGFNSYCGPDEKVAAQDLPEIAELSAEYVFLFDITGSHPRQL